MKNILFLKNKKGSHTGMILSFILFITSLLVIYSVVTIPSNQSLEKKYSIDILKTNLVKEIGHNIITVRIHNSSAGCMSFLTPKNSFSNLKLIGVNSIESEIKTNTSLGLTYVENADNLTKIYYTDGINFSNTLSPASISSCNSINVSNILYENRILEASIIKIINDVNSSYDSLKSTLEVPNNDEFKLEFIYSNSTKIGEFITNDIKTNVYVSEYKINYISLNGEEKIGVIKIGLW